MKSFCTFCRYLCKIPYKIKRILGILKTRFIFICNGVDYKHYRIVGSPIIVVDKGKIVLGDNLQMNNALMDNQIGYNCPCIFRAENGNIIVGNNVGISQSTLIAKGADIIIGNHVKIGGGVKIYTTDFHSLDYEERRNADLDMNNRSCSSVSIEDDCFIGAGVIILKGVHIGARCVIGAGSVVTKNIPSDTIAVGNPCVVIKNAYTKNSCF